MVEEYSLKLDPQPTAGSRVLKQGMTATSARPRRGVMGHCVDVFCGFAPLSLYAGICALWVGVERPPEFYRAALESTPAHERREELAQEVEKKGETLKAAIATQLEWTFELTEEQINSWLVERFGKGQLKDFSDEISEPRVQIHPQLLQVGLKWSQFKNGVLSFDLRPTITGPRELTLKIEALRSGVVPLPASQMQIDPGGVIHGDGWELRWTYDTPRQTFQLNWEGAGEGLLSDWKEIALKEKQLTLKGKRGEKAVAEPKEEKEAEAEPAKP